jgi:hypothetical protein
MGRKIVSKRGKTTPSDLSYCAIVLLDNHHPLVHPRQSDFVAHHSPIAKIDTRMDCFLSKRETPSNAEINHFLPHF